MFKLIHECFINKKSLYICIYAFIIKNNISKNVKTYKNPQFNFESNIHKFSPLFLSLSLAIYNLFILLHLCYFFNNINKNMN